MMDWNAGDFAIMAAVLAGIVALVLFGTGHLLPGALGGPEMWSR